MQLVLALPAALPDAVTATAASKRKRQPAGLAQLTLAYQRFARRFGHQILQDVSEDSLSQALDRVSKDPDFLRELIEATKHASPYVDLRTALESVDVEASIAAMARKIGVRHEGAIRQAALANIDIIRELPQVSTMEMIEAVDRLASEGVSSADHGALEVFTRLEAVTCAVTALADGTKPPHAVLAKLVLNEWLATAKIAIQQISPVYRVLYTASLALMSSLGEAIVRITYRIDDAFDDSSALIVTFVLRDDVAKKTIGAASGPESRLAIAMALFEARDSLPNKIMSSTLHLRVRLASESE